MKYEIGQFRNTIHIFRRKMVTNNMGIQVANYEKIHTLKAGLISSSSREKEVTLANSNRELTLIKLVCRNKEDVSDKDYVFFNDKAYNIRNIQREFGNPCMELLCEEVSNEFRI